MFTIKGNINNKELFLKWDDGKLTGDTEAIEKALEENKKEHGLLGCRADISSKNYLNYQYPAFGLISEFVFEKIIERTDDFSPINPNVIY